MMIDTEGIFRYKIPNREKLIAEGFTYSDGIYAKDVPIMEKQFVVRITVVDAGNVSFKVYESETHEEYALVNVAGADGGFVGDVREACEKVLTDVADKCFDTEYLKAEQTVRIMESIEKTYAVDPEFLWEAYPDCAVFRVSENRKWFAVIMTVEKSKIGLTGSGNIEIIDLKGLPEDIEKRIDGELFFKAYHMNKKHWYTICLDGRIPDEEIGELIDASYRLASGRKKQKKAKASNKEV